MKTIEKFEVEYVIPESEEEKIEIESLILQVQNEEKSGKRNLENLKLVNKKSMPDGGGWKNI